MLTYAATWSQNLHRNRFGWKRLRVLTATTSSQRVQGIKQACAGLARGQGLFLLLDVAALVKHDDILSLPWQTCQSDVHDILF